MTTSHGEKLNRDEEDTGYKKELINQLHESEPIRIDGYETGEDSVKPAKIYVLKIPFIPV